LKALKGVTATTGPTGTSTTAMGEIASEQVKVLRNKGYTDEQIRSMGHKI